MKNIKSSLALKYSLPSIYVVLLALNWPLLIWTIPVVIFVASILLWKEEVGKLLFLTLLFLLLMAFFFGIPRQDKLVCEFDDGDQIIIRQNYKLDLLGLILPIVQSKVYTSSGIFYKPKWWIEEWSSIGDMFRAINFTIESNRLGYCSNFRKFAGIVANQGVSYKLPKGDWQNTPHMNGYFDNELKSLKEKIEENGLTSTVGLTFMQLDASVLLLEYPLLPSRGCYPFKEYKELPPCGVQAVLQSYSHDGGKTWGPLKLTKDAKLYEIGKPLYEQKGIAKPVDWTGKPWKRPLLGKVATPAAPVYIYPSASAPCSPAALAPASSTSATTSAYAP